MAGEEISSDTIAMGVLKGGIALILLETLITIALLGIMF